MVDQVKDELKAAARNYDLSTALNAFRQAYSLSLGQVGQVVGVPASTVKRWEEGVRPRDEHFILAALTIGLADSPRAVLRDLQLQGVEPDVEQWSAFAAIVDGVRAVLGRPDAPGVDRAKMAAAMSGGLKGLMTLITLALMDRIRQGGPATSELGAPGNFVRFLKP